VALQGACDVIQKRGQLGRYLGFRKLKMFDLDK